MTERQDYVKQLNATAARYGKIENEIAKRSVAYLAEVKRGIAAELANVQGWEAYRLKALNANIDRLIAEYEAKMAGALKAAIDGAATTGAQAVTAPLGALGYDSGFFRPIMAQTNIALDFSAQLVQQISGELRSTIDTQIRLAVMGNKSPAQAMQALTRELGPAETWGPYAKRARPARGIAARSETIIRTEVQRVYNLSTYSQQLDAAERIDGLLKGWIATADARTRRGHLRAHMEYKDRPIPIAEPFIVYDIASNGAIRGKAKLMYPGDPSAPGQYTIQCRCRQITIHPEVGRVGSNLDGRIANVLKGE